MTATTDIWWGNCGADMYHGCDAISVRVNAPCPRPADHSVPRATLIPISIRGPRPRQVPEHGRRWITGEFIEPGLNAAISASLKMLLNAASASTPSGLCSRAPTQSAAAASGPRNRIPRTPITTPKMMCAKAVRRTARPSPMRSLPPFQRSVRRPTRSPVQSSMTPHRAPPVSSRRPQSNSA